ncbi:hypothetical protein D3C71_1780990 [compost metagenome]
MAIKAFLLRGLALWIAWARISFPVPLWPLISRLTSDWATIRACSSKRSITGLRVTMDSRHFSSTDGAECSSASSMALYSASLSTGLVRKLNTPCCVAATASGIDPWAVRIITGIPGCSF